MSEITLSKWGDYHQIYAGGMQHGQRINKISMAARGWLVGHVMGIADDWLVFHADPFECLKRAAPDSAISGIVTIDDVRTWLDECERANLIQRYEAEGDAWGVFIQAPPKKTKNGKLAKRYPHPEGSGIAWDDVNHCWIRGASKPSRKSKQSKESSDNRAEQSKAEQNKTKHSSSLPACDLKNMLERMGVPSSHQAMSSVPSLSWLTSADLVATWHERRGASKTPNSPGRLIAKVIVEDGEGAVPTCTPAMVIDAVKAGIVLSIEGQDVTNGAKLTQNASGLYLNGDMLVPTEQLREVSLG